MRSPVNHQISRRWPADSLKWSTGQKIPGIGARRGRVDRGNEDRDQRQRGERPHHRGAAPDHEHRRDDADQQAELGRHVDEQRHRGDADDENGERGGARPLPQRGRRRHRQDGHHHGELVELGRLVGSAMNEAVEAAVAGEVERHDGEPGRAADEEQRQQPVRAVEPGRRGGERQPGGEHPEQPDGQHQASFRIDRP